MITITLWVLLLSILVAIRILVGFLDLPIYYQLSSLMNSLAIALLVIKFSVVMIGFVYETKRK